MEEEGEEEAVVVWWLVVLMFPMKLWDELPLNFFFMQSNCKAAFCLCHFTNKL